MVFRFPILNSSTFLLCFYEKFKKIPSVSPLLLASFNELNKKCWFLFFFTISLFFVYKRRKETEVIFYRSDILFHPISKIHIVCYICGKRGQATIPHVWLYSIGLAAYHSALPFYPSGLQLTCIISQRASKYCYGTSSVLYSYIMAVVFPLEN